MTPTEAGLNYRMAMVLLHAGLTIEQASIMSDGELLKVKNLGRKTLQAIRTAGIRHPEQRTLADTARVLLDLAIESGWDGPHSVSHIKGGTRLFRWFPPLRSPWDAWIDEPRPTLPAGWVTPCVGLWFEGAKEPRGVALANEWRRLAGFGGSP